MNIYQQQILENYHNPLNYGVPAQFTHTFSLANTSCGDEITAYLSVKDNIVTAANFTAQGCSITVATGSLLTQELIGKNVGQIKDLSYANVQELLGIQLSTARVKCAHMPLQAFQSALTTV